MSSFPLLDAAERAPLAPASLEAYARIVPTLSERERVVYVGLCRYCEELGYTDASGMELANFLGTWPTSTRPRLTGLLAKGLVEKTPIRASRVTYEGRVHGYRPVVPREAVERGA